MPMMTAESFESRISLSSDTLPLAMTDGIEVVANRGGAGERQTGDHREDSRERDRRDEAQKERAADRLGKMDGGHVGAAEQIGDLVVGPLAATLEVARVVHQQA